MRKCSLTHVRRSCNVSDYFLVHALFSKTPKILQTVRDYGTTASITGLFILGAAFIRTQTERTLNRSVTYCIGSCMLSIERL